VDATGARILRSDAAAHPRPAGAASAMPRD